MKYRILAYASVFLLGASAGVLGEWLIPKKYRINMTHQCLIQSDTPNLVFMPNTYIYDKNMGESFPLYSNEGRLSSYGVLIEIAIGNLIILSQDDCNEIKTKALKKGI